MGPVVLRRVLLAVPTLLVMTLVTFGIAHLAPGDPLGLAGEDGAVMPARGAARSRAGLDRPWPEQYLRWLGTVAQGELGRSLVDQRPVAGKIAEALPRTLLVSGAALLLSWLVALLVGAGMARGRGGRALRVLDGALVLGTALPPYWVAMVALLLVANPAVVEWFPFQGWAPPGAGPLTTAWHLVLPVVVLAYPTAAITTRLVRTTLEQALARPDILAARGRGVPEGRVVTHHALRGSLGPLLTLAGAQLPHLLGGSVIVERVFGLPGMGSLALEAVGTRDYPVVMAVALIMGVATLAAMLATDLACAWADPRLRGAVRA